MDMLPSETMVPPDTLILVPVMEAALMPGTVMPLVIGRPAAAAALQQAAQTEQHVAVVLERQPFAEDPGLDSLHPIGTEARLLRYFTGHDGSHNAIVLGMGRVMLRTLLHTAPHPIVTVERIAEPTGHSQDIYARRHQLRERGLEILGLIEQAPPELAATLRSIEQAGALADFITGLLDITPAEKQEILETIDLLPRLDRVIEKLSYRLEVLRLSHTIGQQTRQAMEGRQREFMLREQLKAIQKEFGDADEAEPGLDDQKGKLEEAGLPEEIATQARRELRRLERMPEGATEAGMVRTYLEWLTELSWRIEAEPPIDIAAARRVLDEDHFDLDKIKRRIL
jgi:ATP-dependent Lon protease